MRGEEGGRVGVGVEGRKRERERESGQGGARAGERNWAREETTRIYTFELLLLVRLVERSTLSGWALLGDKSEVENQAEHSRAGLVFVSLSLSFQLAFVVLNEQGWLLISPNRIHASS